MATTQKLTTWAGESEQPGVHFLRRTVGPLLIMLLTPPAAILFWIVCRFEPFNGSLLPLFSRAGWQSIGANWPWPSFQAAAIVLGFLLFEAILLKFLPGKRYEGPVTPADERPIYKLNGLSAWAITHAAFFGGSYGLHLFRAGVLWDRLGEILSTLVVAAFVFCIFLYFKGRLQPSSRDHSLTGNVVWDYYWGTELHPTLLGINLKQLINSRFSMMGWSLLACSLAAKQAELSGSLSPTMLVTAGLMVIYLLRFFWWESGYFTSLDVMHDRFGYYICWGVMAWVPAFYTLPAQYQVLRPSSLSWTMAAVIFALGLGMILLNYAVDAQRQKMRATNGAAKVWGKAPGLIRAKYVTSDGQEHESLLLASGWWGLARHFHYVPEIGLALAWSLPAGFGSIVPYLYVIYLTILLTDRAGRDDKRCHKKYGEAWEEYCRRVRWKIVPGLY